MVIGPVGLGLVEPLARPGGNITGFTFINPELIGKWWSLLREVVPAMQRTALLFNPGINDQYIRFVGEIIQQGGPKVELAPVGSMEALRSTIAALGQSKDAGIIIPPDGFLVGHIGEAAALASTNRLPGVSGYQSFAANGGLMAHRPDIPDIFRRSAGYRRRILQGDRPAALPVPEPHPFTLTLYL